MTNQKNNIASRGQCPSMDHGTMTVAEGLLKYWEQISAGWNEQTKLLYFALYLQIIAPIGDMPVSEVGVHKHIHPLVALSGFQQNSSTPMRVCELPPGLQEYLLRRFFWTLCAGEGYLNPFDAVIA